MVGAPSVVCNVRAGFCKDNNDGLGRATHDCGALTLRARAVSNFAFI